MMGKRWRPKLNLGSVTAKIIRITQLRKIKYKTWPKTEIHAILTLSVKRKKTVLKNKSHRNINPLKGLPLWLSHQVPAYNVGDLGLIPGLGRSPGEGKGYPFQYSGLENLMDCIVHGVAKSQTQLRDFHFTSLQRIFKKSWGKVSDNLLF